MIDKNNNMIPDSWDKVIAVVLTVFISVALLAVEGNWWAGATQWLSRAIAIVAILSSVFNWGVVARPGRGETK